MIVCLRSANRWVRWGLALWLTALSVSIAQDPPVETSPDIYAIELEKYPDLRRVTQVLGKRPFLHEQPIRKLAFAERGKTLLTSSRPGVRAWDVATGKLKAEIPFDAPNTIFLSTDRDGARLAMAGDFGEVRVVHWPTMKTIRPLAERDTYQGNITSIALAPDGSRLAVARRSSSSRLRNRIDEFGMLRIWHATLGDVIAEYGSVFDDMYALTWSPDSSVLAVGQNDGEVHFVTQDAELSPPGRVLTPVEEPINGLAFDAAGKRLAAVTLHGSVCLWNMTSKKHVWYMPGELAGRNLAGRGSAAGIAFSPDGSQLYVTHSRVGFWVVDANTGKTVHHDRRDFAGGCAPLVSPEQKVVALGTGTYAVELWNTDPLRVKSDVTLKNYMGTRRVLSTADGKTILTVSADRVHFWDLASGKRTDSLKIPGYVGSVQLHPQGGQLAVAHHDHEGAPSAVVLIDLEKREIVQTLPLKEYAARGVAYSKDGGRVVATGVLDLTMFDVATSKQVWSQRLTKQDEGWLESVRISPDGKTIAVVKMLRTAIEREPRSETSRAVVQLLSAQDGKNIGKLEGPGTASYIEFSDDSQRLFMVASRYSTGSDPFPILQTWDVAKQELLQKCMRANDRPVGGLLELNSAQDHAWTEASGTRHQLLERYDLRSNQLVQSLKLPGSVRDACLLPDEKHLVTANGNGTLFVIRLK